MGQEVKDHLRRALSLMFKPLVRLLIAQGVTHADFSETAKEVYVEVALRHFEREGRINKSRVAILTGLTRKEVKNVIDRIVQARQKEGTLSRPERVLTGWFSDPRYTGPYGIPLELPYDSKEDAPSFMELVKQYSGDMAPRQMLNELLLSGSVIEVENRYKAVRRDYKWAALSPEIINRLGDVGYRVFSTAAKNIDLAERGTGYFDRMVFADEGCTDEEVQQFDKYIKVRGQELLEEIDIWFSSLPKNKEKIEDKKDTGLYMVHYVEAADERESLRDLLVKRQSTEPDDE